MTFLRLLLISAVLFAIASSISTYKQYVFPKALNSYRAPKVLSRIFLDILIPLTSAIIVWLLSFVVIAIVDGDRTVYSCTYNVIASEKQSVVFKERKDNEYIVTVDDKEYHCTDVIISDEVQNIQVVSVEYQWADRIAYFFWNEMSPLPNASYNLYIPVDYINATY